MCSCLNLHDAYQGYLKDLRLIKEDIALGIAITAIVRSASLSLMVAGITFAAAEHAVSVKSIEGNVYITLSDGGQRQVTFGGQDYDPSLSIDGTEIVFARNVSGPAVPVPAEPRPQESPRSELWIIGVTGRNPKRLFSGEVTYKNFRYVNFYSPLFSPDRHYVYFLIPFAAVTDAVVRLDVRTLRTKILTPAEEFTVIRNGTYRGLLLVQRREQEREGVIKRFWLFSSDGEPIREIAETEAGAKSFLERQGQ